MESNYGITVQGLLAAAVRMATPLLLAGLGGLFSAKSGIVSMFLEGFMLVGAFMGFLGSVLTGSAYLGILFARMRCYLAAILAFSYSCLLEYLQGFVPGRTVSIYDLYANATGSILGGLVLLAFYPQLKNVLKKIGLIS